MEEKNKAQLTSSLIIVIVLFSLLAGLVGGLAGNYLANRARDNQTKSRNVKWNEAKAPSLRELTSQGKVAPSFADVAAEILPAVVNISTITKVDDTPEPEILERMLPFSIPRQREGHGSGMLIQSDGLILTNEHVIRNAEKIQATLPDGRQFEAKLVGKDSETDIAVIKIKGNDFPTVRFGDSDELHPGDWAIAIGNPLELDGSVSVGVISALKRSIMVQNRSYSDLIQSDVAIIPGNSGGPLVDAAGNVVGINNAIKLDVDQQLMGAAAARVGFAVPINTVKELLDEIIETGKVIRPWVGIRMGDINKEIAERLKLPQESGVIVIDVVKGSPAAKAGLKAKDIILKVDGKAMEDSKSVQIAVRKHSVGEKTSFEVKRQTSKGVWETQQLTVETSEMPDELDIVEYEENKE